MEFDVTWFWKGSGAMALLMLAIWLMLSGLDYIKTRWGKDAAVGVAGLLLCSALAAAVGILAAGMAGISQQVLR